MITGESTPTSVTNIYTEETLVSRAVEKMAPRNADWSYIINLSNSIIGVSLLAMPFCFKQCGILLGAILLIFSTWLTREACRILMKTAAMTHKRSYAYLAEHTLGPIGKLLVEIGVAGIQLGVCIAFHVIIGDLGPALMTKFFGIPNDANLRVAVMTTLALFIAFPLSLLKDRKKLSGVSAFSIAFYAVLVCNIIWKAVPNLVAGSWHTEVYFFRPENVFQCMPIFSLAYACQTQMFVIYDALPEPSLNKLNAITHNSVSLCLVTYLLVGFFGYIAFHKEDIGGDILLSFPPSLFGDLLKLGFILSLAVSFPLMVAPCRESLNTLLCPQNTYGHGHTHGHTSAGVAPMSNNRFTLLTFLSIGSTLIFAINFPDVEFILGLNGSTTGCLICFVFPALLFLCNTDSDTGGKAVARFVLVMGVTILCISTYSTLSAHNRAAAENTAEEYQRMVDINPPRHLPRDIHAKIVPIPPLTIKGASDKKVVEAVNAPQPPVLKITTDAPKGDSKPVEKDAGKEVKQMPVNPEAPKDDPPKDKEEVKDKPLDPQPGGKVAEDAKLAASDAKLAASAAQMAAAKANLAAVDAQLAADKANQAASDTKLGTPIPALGASDGLKAVEIKKGHEGHEMDEHVKKEEKEQNVAAPRKETGKTGEKTDGDREGRAVVGEEKSKIGEAGPDKKETEEKEKEKSQVEVQKELKDDIKNMLDDIKKEQKIQSDHLKENKEVLENLKKIQKEHHEAEHQQNIQGQELPAAVNPGAVNPAAVNPAAVNPAAVNPAVVNPAAVNPAAVNPAAVNPAAVNPAAVNPAVVNPAAVNPAAVNPAAVNPAAVISAAVNPAAVNPAAVNPAVVNPAVVVQQPQVAGGQQPGAGLPVQPLPPNGQQPLGQPQQPVVNQQADNLGAVNPEVAAVNQGAFVNPGVAVNPAAAVVNPRLGVNPGPGVANPNPVNLADVVIPAVAGNAQVVVPQAVGIPGAVNPQAGVQPGLAAAPQVAGNPVQSDQQQQQIMNNQGAGAQVAQPAG